MISKIIGFFILLGAFTVVYLFETESSATGVMRIFHWPAMVLTGLGPIGLLLIASDATTFWESIKRIGNSPLQLRKFTDNERLLMKDLSEKYYAKGAAAFGEDVKERVSPAFRAVLEKLSLRIPIADIKTLLAEQQDSTHVSLMRSIGFLGLAVKLTPSIGMLGTILGMVNLLSSLQDPSEIGSHMSLALLTTFYGLFFSLVVWTSAQHRVQSMLEAQNQSFDQLDHWLTLLETRKPAEYLVSESVLERGGSPGRNK